MKYVGQHSYVGVDSMHCYTGQDSTLMWKCTGTGLGNAAGCMHQIAQLYET